MMGWNLDYRRRYGYDWWDAVRAELWWRLERLRLGETIYVWAYRRRKAAEHRGAKQ